MDMIEWKHACHVEAGSIYSNAGRIIEDPAVLIEQEPGGIATMHKWGELQDVTAHMDRIAAAYAKAGFRPGDLVVIQLAGPLSREEQAYCIRRIAEYSASRFPGQLLDRIRNDDDPVGFVRAEMARVPIDVTEA